jgi:hypothetical protein
MRGSAVLAVADPPSCLRVQLPTGVHAAEAARRGGSPICLDFLDVRRELKAPNCRRRRQPLTSCAARRRAAQPWTESGGGAGCIHSRDEEVAFSWDRSDVAWISVVVLELGSQVPDVAVDNVALCRVVDTP